MSDSYEIGLFDLNLDTLSGTFSNWSTGKTTEYTGEQALALPNASDAYRHYLVQLSREGWFIVQTDANDVRAVVTMQRKIPSRGQLMDA